MNPALITVAFAGYAAMWIGIGVYCYTQTLGYDLNQKKRGEDHD